MQKQQLLKKLKELGILTDIVADARQCLIKDWTLCTTAAEREVLWCQVQGLKTVERLLNAAADRSET